MSKDIPRHRFHAGFIFLIVFLSIGYFFPRWADPNQNSRLDMIIAAVEDRSFQIDRFVWNTVDYAKVGDHYYSDKAPGTAFVGIPLYGAVYQLLELPGVASLTHWLAESESFGTTLREGGTGVSLEKVRFAIAQVILVLALAALPTALISVGIFYFLARFTESAGPRVLVSLSYGLLTPAWTYGGALYGHQLSALLLFVSFFGVSSRWFEAKRIRSVVLGLLLGYSLLTEFPSVLAIGCIGIYALQRAISQRAYARIPLMIFGGLLPLIGLMAYNNAVFGGPFDLGYAYSELWQDQHQAGFMSLSTFQVEAVWGVLFSSYRGLFFLSPWLLASVVGFILWSLSGVARSEFWCSLAMCVLFLIFNATSVMWWGGFAVGPRYLLPVLPFFGLPAIFTILHFQKRSWFKVVLISTLVWSLVATWGMTLAGQAFPSDTIRNPFIDYSIPAWLRGDIARNAGHLLRLSGVMSLLPLGLILSVSVWVWNYWQKHSAGRPDAASGFIPQAGAGPTRI